MDEEREEVAEEGSFARAILAIDLILGRQIEGEAQVVEEESCHAVALRASEAGEAEELYETGCFGITEAEAEYTAVVVP